MKHKVEYWSDKDGAWVTYSQHINLDYAEANAEVAAQDYELVRIRRGKVVVREYKGSNG